MFSTWFGRYRHGVRADLKRITDRLDALESEKRATPDLESIQGGIGALRGMYDDSRLELATLESSVAELEQEMKDLVLAVSDGIERTDRAERRIKATVKRARRELADHGLVDPGLEAEGAELQLVDDPRSEGGGLQPVRAPVEEPLPEASSIRGVSVDALRRVRGI